MLGNSIAGLRKLNVPKEDENIIVTVHYYDPHEFTHQGAPWITDKDSQSWLGRKWSGDETEKRVILKSFKMVVGWGKKNNRPMNLGEFGAYKKADMASRIRWTKFIADTVAQQGMSFHYWEFCAPEFGLYDQQTKSWRKELLDAVIPPK